MRFFMIGVVKVDSCWIVCSLDLRVFVKVGKFWFFGIESIGMGLKYGLMQRGWVFVIKNRKFDKLYGVVFLEFKRAKSEV